MKPLLRYIIHLLIIVIGNIAIAFAADSFGINELSIGNQNLENAGSVTATITGTTSVCQNSTPNPVITLTGFGGVTPYTFTYQIDGVTQKTIQTVGTETSVQISVSTIMPDTLTYKLVSVKDKSGVAIAQTGTAVVIINQIPDLSINSSAVLSVVDGKSFFKVCSNTIAELTFTNISSTKATNANYTIDWGDGSEFVQTTSWSSLKHIYAIGTWKMTYTINSQNGCSFTKSFDIYVGSNPAVSLGSPGNTDNCSNTPLSFPITGTENNPPGTTYTVSFNDGTPSQTFVHPPPAAITHEFLSTSCGVTSYNGTSPYPNSFSASIVASNMCGVTAVNVVPIYVSTSPKVNFTVPKATVATNNSVVLTNTTTGYVNEGANCKVVPKLVWSITPSTGFTLVSGSLGDDFDQDNSNLWVKGSDVICPMFTVPGVYKIKLRVDTKRCGNDQVEKTICVEAPLSPQFIKTVDSGCTPLAVSVENTTDLSKTCTSTLNWMVTYEEGNCGTAPANWTFTNGTNKQSASPSFSFVTPGKYSIQLAMTNSCGTFNSVQTVIVKSPPTVTLNKIPDFCGAGSFNPTAVINACVPSDGLLSYEWSFPGGNPESANTVDPGTITYNSVGNYSVTLKVTNECGSTVATSNQFAVNPVPVVNQVENQLKNNGQLSDEIEFEGTEDAVFEWTNDNPEIGLAASGSGNIEEFILKNGGNSVITANLTVTPKLSKTGCKGDSKTFTISVNPSGDLNQPNDTILSNGQNTSEINFTTNRTGGKTTYNWTNNNTSIGLAPNGVGNISSFIAQNNTNAPLVSIVTVSPIFENSKKQSVGDSKIFKITVLPTAGVNPLSNLEFCNGIKTSDIIFETKNSIGVTIYSWTNDNPLFGLQVSGTGTISGFNIENKDTVQQVATITVTPTYTYEGVSNTGLSEKFQIKVNPGPAIIKQPVSSYICPSGIVEPLKVEYAYGAGSPTYQWFSNKINSNSGGKIIPDATTNTYLPSTAIPGTTYYYCTISLPSGICSSVTSEVAIIAVNDAAIITQQPLPLQNICIGGTISSALSFEFSGGSGTPAYQWFANNTDSKVGAKAIEGAIYPTYTPPAFTEAGSYFYFVELTMSGDGCGSSTSDIAEIKVVSDPVIDVQPIPNQVTCQNVPISDLSVNATGGLGTYQYQWYSNTVNDNISGSLIPGAVFNTFKPTTNLIGTTYYYCSISQLNGLNCGVTSSASEVIVNPVPVITAQPLSKVVCLNEDTEPLSVTYLYGAGLPTFQWYSNSSNSNENGTIIPGANEKTFKPTCSTIGTTYYYCIISFSNGGCSTLITTPARITVNPVSKINSKKISICNGSDFTVTPINSNGDVVPEGTLYSWSNPVISPANSIRGYSEQPIPVSVINQKLTNITDSLATATYTITPISGACPGDSFTVEVLVIPTIKTNAVVNNVSCFGANNGSIELNIVGGLPFSNTNPFNFAWTGPNNFTATTKDVSKLLPGDYTVTVTDAGGCPVTNSFTVSEPTELIISTDNKKDIDCNNGANGQVSISVTGGKQPYTYDWKKNGVSFATTKDVTNLTPADYTLVVLDASGCSSKPVSYKISEPQPLVVKVTKQTNLNCFGESTGAVSVEVSGGTPIEVSTGVLGYNYSWSGLNKFSSTQQNLTNLVAGIYQLTVTDKNGCTKILPVTISQPDELIVETKTNPISCYEAKDASITLNITGGTKPYNIEWSNFGSGISQENLSEGDYFIIVTDANNCQKTAYVSIKEADFAIQPVIKNVSCNGANDGSINLNITGGLKPITLVWQDNPTTGNPRNHLGPGIYTVTLHDGAPCNITESFMISEPSQIEITANVTNAYNCDITGSGVINLNVQGGTLPYTYKWSNGSTKKDLINVPAGKYSVIVTDSVGCSKSAEFEVFRPSPLKVGVNTRTEYDCGLDNLKMICEAQISGGFSPYKIIWSSGTVSKTKSEIMETSQNSVITLVVTDSLGCTATYMFNVDLPKVGIEYSLVQCSKFMYQFIAADAHIDAINYVYSWDFGDGETAKSMTPLHSFKKPGIYKVRMTVSNGTCGTTFEENVFVNQISPLTLDREPKYCEGDSTVLHVSGANSYKWSNGNTGDSIVVKQTADYSVIGTSVQGCKDTLYFVTSSNDLYNYTIQSDKTEIIPDGSPTQLSSEYIVYSQYVWDFGDGTVGQGDHIEHVYHVNKEGYYDIKLKVINPNGCSEKVTKRIWITAPEFPNTFSPNGDGINDYFLPTWDIKVYNRNGATLYEGSDGWDGKYHGNPVANDIYFFVVYYPSETGTKTKSGYVRVIR